MAETVGLIGLGLVGKAMVRRLVPAGWTVLGWDIDPAARDQVADLGAHVPLERAPAEVLRAAIAAGLGDADNAGLIEVLREAQERE